MVRRISLKPALLTIAIDRLAVVKTLIPDASIVEHDRENVITTFVCPLTFKRRGVEMRMLLDNAANQHLEPIPISFCWL
ncbi:MAG: hypothetical protein KF874_09225 [Rhizobiaceae bacterium]|nr:hypothetical protein [Rhizobiaceae bacterium]